MSAQEPKAPQGQLTNAFTGETFTAKARNHYEVNDGVPVAPALDTPRPTVRQRVENLLSRGEDPLRHYIGHEGIDMDIPDDEDAPLTRSEQNYIDVIAADLAEQAPLPDEGLPRPQAHPGAASAAPLPSAAPSTGAPPGAAQAPGEGVKP